MTSLGHNELMKQILQKLRVICCFIAAEFLLKVYSNNTFQYFLRYMGLLKYSGLALIWSKWFIKTVLYIFIQPLGSALLFEWGKHGFLFSIFVVGHQGRIVTGVGEFSPTPVKINLWCPTKIEIWIALTWYFQELIVEEEEKEAVKNPYVPHWSETKYSMVPL